MSSIAHQQTYTAPRASPSAAGYNPGTLAPMPFAPTLGAQSTGPNPYNTRLSTPLATAPPPPLHLTSSAPPIPRNSHQQQFRRDHSSPSYGEDKGHSATGVGRRMKYASNEHTLGPTFSEEEDGDDSDWIASKMASLGLDPNGKPYAGGFAQVSVVANTYIPHAMLILTLPFLLETRHAICRYPGSAEPSSGASSGSGECSSRCSCAIAGTGSIAPTRANAASTTGTAGNVAGTLARSARKQSTCSTGQRSPCLLPSPTGRDHQPATTSAFLHAGSGPADAPGDAGAAAATA